METLTDDQLLAGYLAPYTGQTRRQYWRVMLDWLSLLIEARIGLLDATRQHIEAWSAAEQRRGLSAGSVGSRLVVVCGFYRWAAEEGHLTRDPAVHVRRPRKPRRSNLRWLEADELIRLLDAARDLDGTAHVLVCLLGLNGLRLTETIEAGVQHLGTQGDLTTLLLPSRKGGVMDRVSLPARTVEALGPLIEGRSKGRILRTPQRRAFTQAGMSDRTCSAPPSSPSRWTLGCRSGT